MFYSYTNKAPLLYEILWYFNLSCAKARIFGEKWVNAMTADGLATLVARPSVATALIMLDKQALVFHMVGYHLLVPFKCEILILNLYTYFIFKVRAFGWYLYKYMKYGVVLGSGLRCIYWSSGSTTHLISLIGCSSSSLTGLRLQRPHGMFTTFIVFLSVCCAKNWMKCRR